MYAVAVAASLHNLGKISLPAAKYRDPVLLEDTHRTTEVMWDKLGKLLATWYRNHSCKCVVGLLATHTHTSHAMIHSYLGNQRDCHASMKHYKGDPQIEPIGEYTGPVHASVLDFGADPTGRQLQVLSGYFNVRSNHVVFAGP